MNEHASNSLPLLFPPCFQDGKNTNKPKSASTTEKLTLHGVKSGNKVATATGAVRPDLAKVAKLRFVKASKGLRVAKGYSKKAAKSTRRGAAKP